jgi:hypothetical protein
MGENEWGMLWMQNESVCDRYTTVQRLYRQTCMMEMDIFDPGFDHTLRSLFG